MVDWKIYYGDGSTFSSDDGTSKDAPARGVQVIVQDHPDVGVELVTASDYYVLDGGRWRGVDMFGLFDFLLGSGIVLFGRMTSREEYDAIFRKAAADKTGWLPREVKSDG